MARIGFIGTGVMGRSMALNLLKNGNELYIYTRTKDKADDVIDAGAHWCDTVAELAKSCPVIFTMVGYPQDVEEIYLNENGILHNAKEGTYVVDFTTSKPSLAQYIYSEGKKRNIHTLDAPVSGGDIGAREARLAIMVGGAEKDFESMLPIFKQLGTNIQYQGEAGSGQHTKMCNQIAIATNMIGVIEALAYAKTVGLDAEKVLESISTGAAGSWSLSNLAPRVLQGNFEPGFFIKHFVKDMEIAMNEAERAGTTLPGLELSLSMYQDLLEEGFGDKGTQALYKWYRQGQEE